MASRPPQWRQPLSLLALALMGVALVLLFSLDRVSPGLAVLVLAQLVNIYGIKRANRGTTAKWYAPKLPPQ